jgi:RND family efflux transporter MFP subunit
MTDLKSELASLRIDRERPAAPRRWPLLLLIPALAILGVLYAMRASGRGGTEVQTASAALVPGGTSAGGAAILTASGYVVARRKAVVSAKIQGRLADLRVEEGDRVREGQMIARLESSDYEAQVQRAQALLQRAQADLAENERVLRQANDLAKQQIASRDQVDVAESRVRIAQAAMAQARAEIGYAQAQMQNTRILAPFSGTVVKKMAEVGESVAPIPPGVNLSTSSGAIVAIADLETLEVEADVTESNVGRLGPEQPAEVTVEAFPDRRYRGVLRQIIPTADRTKATVQVKVTIIDKDAQLRPEMSAKVQFEEPKAAEGAPSTPMVTVPSDAIARRDGKAVVFEVLEGHVKMRPVVTGADRQGRVVVKSGLLGVETLVARPPESLSDGDVVRVSGDKK